MRPSFNIQTKTGHNLRLSSEHSYEDIDEAFSLTDDVDVPVGRYWFHEGEAQLRVSRGALLRPNFTIRAGSFYDGWKTTFQTSPTWILSSHLELQAEYELNLVRFNDRAQRFDAHIGRFRVRAALNSHFSINTFVQYSNLADLFSVNARLRYHFTEGNDLWFVYNEGVNTQRHQIDAPHLPATNNRALLLKYEQIRFAHQS